MNIIKKLKRDLDLVWLSSTGLKFWPWGMVGLIILFIAPFFIFLTYSDKIFLDAISENIYFIIILEAVVFGIAFLFILSSATRIKAASAQWGKFFEKYGVKLDSVEWKEKKLEAIQAAKNICKSCGSKDEDEDMQIILNNLAEMLNDFKITRELDVKYVDVFCNSCYSKRRLAFEAYMKKHKEIQNQG
ncbi:MAG: hypothetical protein ABID38_06490 [Candidatus Diapherotrites archaeon]